jgi:glucokinase
MPRGVRQARSVPVQLRQALDGTLSDEVTPTALDGPDRCSPIPVLEIGGTHVTAALVDPYPGRVAPGTRRSLPLRPTGAADEILDTLSSCASALGATVGATWGVAIPGPFDYAHGIGRFNGVAKFESLSDVDVGQALVRAIRPSPSRLLFVNDADAFLIGEGLAGAAVGHDRAAGVTLGTGVGSAFLDRGGDRE